MRDLTSLIGSRDCTTHGCPYEADRDDIRARHDERADDETLGRP